MFQVLSVGLTLSRMFLMGFNHNIKIPVVIYEGRYMAPELYRNDPDYDKSVDVFSFALIVQEVCFSFLILCLLFL